MAWLGALSRREELVIAVQEARLAWLPALVALPIRSSTAVALLPCLRSLRASSRRTLLNDQVYRPRHRYCRIVAGAAPSAIGVVRLARFGQSPGACTRGPWSSVKVRSTRHGDQAAHDLATVLWSARPAELCFLIVQLAPLARIRVVRPC